MKESKSFGPTILLEKKKKLIYKTKLSGKRHQIIKLLVENIEEIGNF